MTCQKFVSFTLVSTGNLFIQDNDETNSPFTAPQLISDFLLSSCYLLKDTIAQISKIQFFKILAINGIITTTPVNIPGFRLTDSVFPFYLYRAHKQFNKYRFYSEKTLVRRFSFTDFVHSPAKWDSVIPLLYATTSDVKTCTKEAKVLSMQFLKDTLYMKIESPCYKYLFIPYRFHRGIKAILND